jgi:WD40 repeat protein
VLRENPAPYDEEANFNTAMAFNRAGTSLATATADGSVKVWTLLEKEFLAPERWKLAIRLRDHHQWVRMVMFNSDGSRVVTASADGTALVWDATPSVMPVDAAKSPISGLIAEAERRLPVNLSQTDRLSLFTR